MPNLMDNAKFNSVPNAQPAQNMEDLVRQAMNNPRAFEEQMKRNNPQAYQQALRIRNSANPQAIAKQMAMQRGINPSILRMLGLM